MEETGSMRRGRGGAFAVVLTAGFMALLDVSIVNVALPSIESSLGASESAVQWIVAGYSLTFGLLLVAGGRAGDILGRRPLFIIGVSGFVLASLGCGLAPSTTWLVVTRLFQGACAGILNPQVLGLIQDLFQGRARARAFGIYGVVVGISTALGPLIGGGLIAAVGPDLGWRAVFLINVPIGLVLIPLAYRWLPAKAGDKTWTWKQVDVVGIVMLGITVVSIMWPFLSTAEGAGEGSWWLLTVAPVAILLLWWWEKFWAKHDGAVLLDPRLWRSPAYVIGVATGFMYFAGFTSIFVVVTMYLQQGIGFTPLEAGLAQIPFAVLSGVTAGISGRLVSRFGRVIPVVGSAVMCLSLLATTITATMMSSAMTPWILVIGLGFAGLGSGLVISPNQALTLDNAPGEVAGVAAALLQTMQRMGTSIGLAAVTTVFFVGVQTRGYESGLIRAFTVVIVFLAFTVALNVADMIRSHRSALAQVHDVIA